LKKTVLITAAIVMMGFPAVQTSNADPGHTRGHRTSPRIECSDEQRALMHEYREKKQELRSELRKDDIDGKRVSALIKELKEMRAAMDLPERTRPGSHKGERTNRSRHRHGTR